MKRLLVFTDLDGTLLDAKTYSFEEARPALDALARLAAPLVLCSSKTRAELLRLRARLDHRDPFVSENGGGVFLPASLVRGARLPDGHAVREEGGLVEIRLGVSYRTVRAGLEGLRAAGFRVRGFGDMTAEEIAGRTGLSLEEAQLAQERDFAEPFVFEGPTSDEGDLERAAAAAGLRVERGGRFFHLHGKHDKGTAVRILRELYARLWVGAELRTAAVGDAANDLPMLEAADAAFLVERNDGERIEAGSLEPRILRVAGAGPGGFRRAIERILEWIERPDAPEDRGIWFPG